ncbi:MAG: M20 family metallopeptidase [Candidatus Aerophobus sp.]|nr:MAG: M20 family metallopeptidase [Candidatus Aerophobus sp.]
METGLDALSLTQKLLSFNTINPPGLERDCAEFLGNLLEEGGFQTSFHEFNVARTSLIARLDGKENKPAICFTGHTDTAPLGAASWSKDPFKGEIDRDKIYGRGASDMKGAVAAMVVAALRVAKMPRRPAGMTLIITAGEETGSQGAYHLAKLGDKLGKVGAIVVGEPTANYPFVGHKGALWLEARTAGVTAHGSMPEQGVNAIYNAVQVITKLQKYDFNVTPHPLLGAPTLNVGTISGGLNINSVPDQATIGIDIRTIPGQVNREVYELLQSYLGGEVELRRMVDVGSVATDPQDNWVQEVFHIMESFLKERPVARGATYFTDASILTPTFDNAPTIILGPGEPTMAHKTDEFCYIDKIEQATEAYFEIAKNWCNL